MDLVSSACETVFDEIDPGGRLFVGFSGGMDSTVLLHALASRSDRDRARLVAVHVDHGLDPSSPAWRGHCERVAESLGVACQATALTVRPGGSLEARARTARYHTFTELLEPGDGLALAHHRDDRDESVLLHLLQGRGLFGMPARRVLGKGVLIRPLLELPRTVLEAYARAHELDWLEDPANLDPALDRNFLRERILPLLHERFPSLSERLDRVIRHSADTERALVETLGLQRHPLPLAVLNGLSRGATVSVLRHWLIERDAASGIRDSALHDYLSQLDAANDRQPELPTAAGVLRRYRRHLYLVGAPPALASAYALPAPGTLDLPHGRLEVSSSGEDGLLIHPDGPLTVRFLESLEPGVGLHLHGHDRRVRECLREAGVPPWRRDSHPLVEDRRGLLAIAGVAARDVSGMGTGDEETAWRLIWEPHEDGAVL